jgi:acyl-CoA oxidase
MNKEELSNLIFGDRPEKRDKWFELFKDPVWVPHYNIPLSQHREEAMARLKKVAEQKMASVTDFFTDPINIFTSHEMLGSLDPSTATKFTVHFNLFGGTITEMGTERHKNIFPKIDYLSVFGCFCYSELGYGNNAIEMETTVEYDSNNKEFIINSPTALSQKYWIANSALHADHALVFG